MAFSISGKLNELIALQREQNAGLQAATADLWKRIGQIEYSLGRLQDRCERLEAGRNGVDSPNASSPVAAEPAD